MCSSDLLGHLKPGIADLEAALALQQADPTPHAYYARTFTSLGDAYFRADQHARAAATWKAGLDAFPAYAPLRTRLGAAPKALDHLIDEAYDADRPIDTSLADMWER